MDATRLIEAARKVVEKWEAPDRDADPELAEAVNELREAIPEPRKPVLMDDKGLLCPDCGHRDFQVTEDVRHWYKGVRVEGYYSDRGPKIIARGGFEYSDGGEDMRLTCEGCWIDFAIPEGIDVEWT